MNQYVDVTALIGPQPIINNFSIFRQNFMDFESSKWSAGDYAGCQSLRGSVSWK